MPVKIRILYIPALCGKRISSLNIPESGCISAIFIQDRYPFYFQEIIKPVLNTQIPVKSLLTFKWNHGSQYISIYFIFIIQQIGSCPFLITIRNKLFNMWMPACKNLICLCRNSTRWCRRCPDIILGTYKRKDGNCRRSGNQCRDHVTDIRIALIFSGSIKIVIASIQNSSL